MKLECDPNRPGDLYLNGALFASIHPGQVGLSDEPMAQLRQLAAEVARRWNQGALIERAEPAAERKSAPAARAYDPVWSEGAR